MSRIFSLWFSGIGASALDVFGALFPIVIIFFLLRLAGMRVNKRDIKKILSGFVITYFGLVFFMQGVHVAFVPVGTYLGGRLAAMEHNWLLIPIGFVIGFLVAFAEPAVHVMTKQVEELSTGTIKSGMLLSAISIGVACAVMSAMIRLLYNIPLWYFLVPGYVIIFLLARKIDPTFMAIAFDNGGVATGPMCSTFILAMSVAVAGAIPGRNPLTDGFGIVALIAMAPIITTMLLSVIVQSRKKPATIENTETITDLDNTIRNEEA